MFVSCTVARLRTHKLVEGQMSGGHARHAWRTNRRQSFLWCGRAQAVDEGTEQVRPFF